MMADSLPSAHRFATPLPHAEASASNNLEPKQLFLSETFAFSLPHAGASASNNLEPKHLFLGEAFAFSLTLLRGVFLAGQSFPPRRRTAVTKRWRGPMRQELCLSLCRSSLLWRLRSLLEIAAVSPLLGADSSVAARTVSAIN